MGNDNSDWSQLEDELVKLGLYDESGDADLVDRSDVKSRKISVGLTSPRMDNAVITLMVDGSSVRLKRVFDSDARELDIFERPYNSADRPTITVVKDVKSFDVDQAIEALRNMCSAKPDYDSVILENKGEHPGGPDDKPMVFDRSSSNLMRTCIGMMVCSPFDKSTPSIVKHMIDDPIVKQPGDIVFSMLDDSNGKYEVYGLTRPRNNHSRIIPYSYSVTVDDGRIASVGDLRIDVFSKARAEDDGMFFSSLSDNARGDKGKKNKFASFKAAVVKGMDDEEFNADLFKVLFCALYGYPESAGKYVEGLEISDDFDKFLGRNALGLRGVCVFLMSYVYSVSDYEQKAEDIKLKVKKTWPSGRVGTITMKKNGVVSQVYLIRPAGEGKFKIVANTDMQSTRSDSTYESVVRPDEIASTVKNICSGLA